MTGELDSGERRAHHAIEVADETLTYRTCHVDDRTPTGAQLAAAAGYKPAQGIVVLRVMQNGDLEDIRPDEIAPLSGTADKFIIVESDREYMFGIDGQRINWPCQIISGAVLRKLGGISPELGIYFELANQPDRLIGDHDTVNLNERGIESFVSRKMTWRINVQGVDLDVATPTITVRQAMLDAGFDVRQEWHIYLKVAGHPKQERMLDDVIDLRTPGIEKLRLTPKNVNNGEGPPPPRREFALLDVDEQYLDRLKLRWETIVDQGRRWLVIENYPVPAGYNVASVTMALEIPPPYPGAQIDMFYTDPPLTLMSGRAIDCTHIAATIREKPFNGWSRHRGPGSEWNPEADNVITHLALVESALVKEVGE